MVRVYYTPRSGKGKAVSVIGFRRNDYPLDVVFGDSARQKSNSTVYTGYFTNKMHTCRVDVHEYIDPADPIEVAILAGIDTDFGDDYRHIFLMAASNDPSYLDKMLPEAIEKAGMAESNETLDSDVREALMQKMDCYLRACRKCFRNIGMQR